MDEGTSFSNTSTTELTVPSFLRDDTAQSPQPNAGFSYLAQQYEPLCPTSSESSGVNKQRKCEQ